MPVVAQAAKEEPVAKTSKMSWQCKVGLHRWKPTGHRTRKCRKCGLDQYWDLVEEMWFNGDTYE